MANERNEPLRVAIVGAGPAGFYAAVELLKAPERECEVDMFDRLPTPFGLVRHGVAPDHEKIKSVTRVYTGGVEAGRGRYRMFGNVHVGRDVTLAELRRSYHAVILATGAQSDRRMGVPGEQLVGVHPASVFVAWYNGHPDCADLRFDLSAERAVVIGMGNVAIDVARILSRDHRELLRTDMADHAIRDLSGSGVREVVMIGRSGPAQSSFTFQEMRELSELEGVDLVAGGEDRELDPLTRARYEAGELEMMKAKNAEVILERTRQEAREGNRSIRLRFFRSPVEVLGDGERVTGIRLMKNRLVERDGRMYVEQTGETEDLACGLVFRSIGYRVVPLENVPFDEVRSTIPHERGQVLRAVAGPAERGLFVTGWAKRGPSGIIGTNKPDAQETVATLLQRWEAGELAVAEPKDISALLDARGVSYVTYTDWKLLDQIEVRSGKEQGRPRRKFTEISGMLQAIAEAKSGGGA